VLVLIAEGKSTKEAAATWGSAVSLRSRILEKLGVHETASMVHAPDRKVRRASGKSTC